ncbi:MAG: hypothetical protein KDC46_08365 [Thermoleophilia bacterium]|nr:hypothetical protein [Thermoleophilia bacterium]
MEVGVQATGTPAATQGITTGGGPPPAPDQQYDGIMQQLVDALLQMVADMQSKQPAAAQAATGPATLAGGPLAYQSMPAEAGTQATQSAGAVGQPPAGSTFRIASFNFLGSSHTAAGGNKPGYRSGAQRAKDAVEYLDRNGVDVAGFQEFQGSQQQAFRKLKPGWKMVVQQDNAIAWNDEKFKLVKQQSVTIPYFEGNPRKMPVVQLEDRATGKRVWMVDVHNPASTKDHPGNEASRDKATKIEQQLLDRLRATGLPVLLVGDFNEATEARKKFSSMDGFHAYAPSRMKTGIDMIFGSSDVAFSDAKIDRATQSSKTSDHPMVVATATL